MYGKTNSLAFFKLNEEPKNDTIVNQIIIPTSVEHSLLRHEPIATIAEICPNYGERIQQLSSDDYQKLNNYLAIISNADYQRNLNNYLSVSLLNNQDYSEWRTKGLHLTDNAIIETYLQYVEKKLDNKKMGKTNTYITRILSDLFRNNKTNYHDVHFLDLIQLKQKRFDILREYLFKARDSGRMTVDFVNEAIVYAKNTKLPKVQQLELINSDLINYSDKNQPYTTLGFSSGLTLCVHSSLGSGAFGSVQGAAISTDNQTLTHTIKTYHGDDDRSEQIAKKEAKFNCLFGDASFYRNKSTGRWLLMYTYVPGVSLASMFKIPTSPDIPSYPEMLNFSLERRLRALLYPLYQLKTLQDKFVLHDDPREGNVLFDKSSCRLSICDFGRSGTMQLVECNRSNYIFIIMIMKAVFCDPKLNKQCKTLSRYDYQGSTVEFDSREKIFKLGTPIENAIIQLLWALDHESSRSANKKCTFGRAIEYCTEILAKKENLTDEQVIEIANKHLYDNNISNYDITQGKTRQLTLSDQN
jgi:hypothetical protein